MNANYNGDKKVLFRIRNFRKYFPIKKSSFFQKEQLFVKANDKIFLDIYEGETLGLVGESGCGKSTLGRVILQLYSQTNGYVTYSGRSIYQDAPEYIEKTLTKLSEEKKTWVELRKKADQIRDEYSNLDENERDIRQYILDGAYKAADDKRDVILQLIGGLVVADDMNAVSQAVLREYHAGVKVTKAGDKATKEDKSEWGVATRAVELLRTKYQSHPDFEKYDIYRETGLNLAMLTKEEMRDLRKDLQIIFQDPYSSLDARMTIGQIIGEGLLTHKYFEKNGNEMQNYIMKTMEECGLAPYFFHRYPHQFSGGQRQRIGIARSLALRPKFIVCDEAVSALDVSIQSQIINLLLDLKEKQNLTYLFISHDLSVIKYISDRICVMYLGNMMELAPTRDLFNHPMHPYTYALLSAIPTTDVDEDNKKDEVLLEGDIPSPVKPPKGCKFHTRCIYCTDICMQEDPVWEEKEPGHFVACHHCL